MYVSGVPLLAISTAAAAVRFTLHVASLLLGKPQLPRYHPSKYDHVTAFLTSVPYVAFCLTPANSCHLPILEDNVQASARISQLLVYPHVATHPLL